MTEERNPFTPGFSRVPAVFAGREAMLGEFDEALAVAALDGGTPTTMVLVGPRGMGKTVLLYELSAKAAQSYGWPSVSVEARPRASLVTALQAQVRRVTMAIEDAPRRPRVNLAELVLKAGVGGVGGEAHLSRDTPPVERQSLRDSVEHLLGRLQDHDGGLVLVIDEAQNASQADLAEVGELLQIATRMAWPLVSATAGLPALRPGKLPSYFERADWHPVTTLSLEATLQSLVISAREAGRPFEPDAAGELAAYTGGYPYAVQFYGHAAWRASAGEQTITRRAVRRAEDDAYQRLSTTLFPQRLEQASPREREYLRAVAELLADGQVPTGQLVANHLGRTTQALAQHRDRLLTKGTLLAGEDHALCFFIPAMATFVRDEAARPPTMAALADMSFPVVRPTRRPGPPPARRPEPSAGFDGGIDR